MAMGNIVKVIDLTTDEQIREEARRREKRLHDEATALNFARKEGVAEGEARGRVEGETSAFATVIETMRKNGFTEEQIKLALGENYTG
jgi:predicted transposase YdaD